MVKKRRRREFLPDKTDPGIINKLYLTRKQRLTLLKWLLIALTLIAMSVIQDTMLSQLRLLGAAADVVPCAIFLMCVLQDVETCCVLALISSMAYLFSGTAPGPYAMVYITFLAFGTSVTRQSYLRKGFGSALLCTGGALLIYELAVFFTGLGMGLTRLDRAPGFLVTWLMTLLAIPVVYPIVNAIDRIGGESWKE